MILAGFDSFTMYISCFGLSGSKQIVSPCFFTRFIVAFVSPFTNTAAISPFSTSAYSRIRIFEPSEIVGSIESPFSYKCEDIACW